MYDLDDLAKQHVGNPDSDLLFVTDSAGNVIASFVGRVKLKQVALDLASEHSCIVEDRTGVIYDPSIDG